MARPKIPAQVVARGHRVEIRRRTSEWERMGVSESQRGAWLKLECG